MKIKRGGLALLMLLYFFRGYSQLCTTELNPTCCENMYFLVNPVSISYLGNVATVNFQVFTAPPPACGSAPYFTNSISKIVYSYGDTSAIDSAQVVPSSPGAATFFSFSHAYTLPYVCDSATFIMNFCLKGIEAQCVKTYKLKIPHPGSLFTINSSNTNCKSFTFSYTGPFTVPNTQWTFGDGSYSSIIPNSNAPVTHNYPAGGQYVITLTGEGVSPCIVSHTINVADFVTPDFNYTVNNVCSYTGGVKLEIPNYNNAYSYSWQINGLSVPFISANANYFTNLQNGANIIKLYISNGLCTTSVTKIVNIGLPSPSFNVTSSDVCTGDALSVFGVNSGADTYTWKIKKPDNTYAPSIIGMNPFYVFTNPGTYQVKLVITKTYGVAAPCKDSVSVNINVVNKPNAAFTVSGPNCNNGVTIAVPSSVYTSYSINYGDGSAILTGGGSISGPHLLHTYVNNGIYVITLTLNNGNGCTSVYTQNVSVNNLAILNVVASSPYLCPGGFVSLSASLNNLPQNAGTLVYSWTGPGGFTSSQSNISVSAGGTYNLSVTSNGGCVLNLTGTKVVTAVVAPVPSIISSVDLNCSGTGGYAIISIPTNLVKEGYYINGILTPANPSATSPVQDTVFNLVAGTNYVTVANGLYQACNASLIININKTDPVITVSATNPTDCNSNSGSAVVTIVPSTGNTIKWYTVANYPNTPFQSGSGTSVSGLAPGSYAVKAENGICSSTTYFNIVPPSLSLSKIGAASTCLGNTIPVTINAQFSPQSVTGSFTYAWLKNGNAISGSSNNKNIGPGSYVVNVTGNNCNASLSFQISVIDSIKINLGTNLPTCSNSGNINASVSGGDGNYAYKWFVNTVQNISTLPSLYLDTVSGNTDIYVTVKDSSGCTTTSSLIKVKPVTPVTLCSGSPITITDCYIQACVLGGISPYSFQWSKLNKLVEWRFRYVDTVFVAITGNDTLVVPIPTDSTNLSLLNLSLNFDTLVTTVSYPYWNFTGPNPIPIFNNDGLFLSASPTSFISNYYFKVSELVNNSGQESFVKSYSGPSNASTDNEGFTTDEYILRVSDAMGCTYTFNLGELIFNPQVVTFPIDTLFYVWGMDRALSAKSESNDVVLHDEMIEAANDLAGKNDKCMAEKSAALKSYLQDTCNNPASFKDVLNVAYIIKDHQHTLYYYDRAGRLTKTVPPEGVEYLKENDILDIKEKRENINNGSWHTPPHRMATTYQYNSFGQLLKQNTPDGGASKFIYDSKNRLRFSQNAEQKTAGAPRFSYTKYDELGRIIEVGESNIKTGGPDFLSASLQKIAGNITLADNMLYPPMVLGNREITYTKYTTISQVTYYGKPQRNTQNRVSYTWVDVDPNVQGDEHYSYYSYDTHGNVEWIVQDNKNGMGKDYIAYQYDLVSGKVLQVAYNEKRADRFFHRYKYDAENRLTLTETSRNGEVWDKDADYSYYPHGPLKRSVIGEDKVQGLDYIYTLNGWLKSINSPKMTTQADPGKDNDVTFMPVSGNPQERVAADRHGMVLNYYNEDYKTNTPNFLTASGSIDYNLTSYNSMGGAAPSLFNGNISSWVQGQLNPMATAAIDPRVDLFKYDVLNRIKQNTSLKPDTTVLNGWKNISASNGSTFKTNYDYDANGNILSLNRYDDLGILMDSLRYSYDNGSQIAALNSNRLSQVRDMNTAFLNGRSDFENTHQYTYDSIGNLVKEIGKERVGLRGTPSLCDVTTNITWNVYGKIKEITKLIDSSGFKINERLRFAYDASGNRVKKEFWRDNVMAPDGIPQSQELTITYYTRDAQGNPMATYQKGYDPSDSLYKYRLIEQAIYGSSRLGMNMRPLVLVSDTGFSTLAAPASGINKISEYQNWITSTSKTQLLPNGSVNDNLCQCKIVSMQKTAQNVNYQNIQTAVQFLGIAHNGIALAEDLNGKLQFYVVLAKKYLGHKDACLIFDREGNLMQGVDSLNVPDINSKPIIVNIPGSGNYAVIVLDQNKIPQYHIVNTSLVGYGGNLASDLRGKVTSRNMPLTLAPAGGEKFGYHFTGLENHISGNAIVYASRYNLNPGDSTKGTTDIMAYDFGATTTMPQEYLLYSTYGCGNTEAGELQISPQGDKLAWYRLDKTLAGFTARSGEIHTLQLDPLKTGVIGPADVKPISNAGNFGYGKLDFMHNNNDILYSQRGVYREGPVTQHEYDRNVWKYIPLNLNSLSINPDNLGASPTISYLFGEIRRGKDGKQYIPNMGKPADKIHAYTGSTWSGFLNLNDTSYRQTASLPTQVHKIFGNLNQNVTYERHIGAKTYELNDHLANVRVVISDAKLVTDVNTDNYISGGDSFEPEVTTYSDYYAFGQPMPGRQFNNGSYRYGFNGKENDNEVKGNSIQQDYGLRIYDSRIVRFLSVDPLTAGYPSWSPYPFAMNRPIDGIDLDGGEWKPTKDKDGEIIDYTWDGYDENGKAREGTVANASLSNGDLTLTYGSNAEKQMGYLKVSGKTEYTNYMFGSSENNFKLPISINSSVVFSDDNAVWGPVGCPSCPIGELSGDYNGASGAEIAGLVMPKTIYLASGRLEGWYPETFFIPVERIFFIGAKFLARPAISSLGAAYKGFSKSQKFIFPSWKKVTVDMQEVLSGHAVGGSRIAANSKKDIFPAIMNEKSIKTAVLQAYNNIHTIVMQQGDRYLIQGTTKKGMEIQMWFNKATKEIETAYPQY